MPGVGMTAGCNSSMNQSVKIEKPASTDAGFLFAMGWKMGLEPTTFGTTIRRSNQLSYVHHISHFLSNAGAKIIPILILCKDIAKKTLIFCHHLGFGLHAAAHSLP